MFFSFFQSIFGMVLSD